MEIHYIKDLDKISIEIYPSRDYLDTREVTEDVTVDFDKHYTPLRIEIKNASKYYPRQFINQIKVWKPRT